ncbi:MAG TPA: alkaline phosphatase D family protein [Acidimicrobiales bacterium]|nr:alkaline phosphatase D family protein [Acidimicrobiales bacterium]
MTSFRHGVASADPLPDGVLLWTRCTTGAHDPVAVEWWVSRTADGSGIVARGTAEASPDSDFTVHVDVGGLEPSTPYWYGFAVGATSSPMGRTRTAPDGPVDRLRVGLTSCAYWSCGFFNAYAGLAARDLDVWAHVGDYLYENDKLRGSRRAVRAHQPPGPLLTLDDYRTRHAQYRTDPDLQALHARHPVVAVWDDHEVVGDAWRGGAGAHRRGHGVWEDRRAAAIQAYFEWMPVRRHVAHSVYRTVRLGPLADLVMLDTRLAGRDRPANPTGGAVFRVSDPGRALLGEEQWRWLEGELRGSSGQWLLVGNQVMLAPLRVLDVAGGLGVNPGQWDGYPAERRRFYDTVRAAGRTSNVAVLTGDLHSSWAADLPVGAEFVTASVTTDSFARTTLPRLPGASALARRIFLCQNRHLRLADLERHGYVVVDVSPERIQADWWHVDTIARRDPGARWGGGWWLADGELGLRPAEAPAQVSSAPAAGRSPR